ncbi:hypothetical protein PHSY_003837 [Pseudozyma hubeiensis SY62]|uniref:Uncharacterized protein n=1 Tax=Pseudozyma hubeiensis (strain SY62) TaxID=1305764 RepID=R9P4T8_PSEHS|nr:hypothetical protein PHSY_003837 [Pseudozyma hubeiensis SY62]GAC96257.1 hypothetical protein PHSY_003837 [Pseudozyma hubeiensis SY62]
MFLPTSLFLLASAIALQAAASAPRCSFQYSAKKGLHPTSGCPHYPVESTWTHCCIVPMSKYDRNQPKAGKYTGVCASDPMIGPDSPDICMPLVKKPPSADTMDPIADDWTLH